MSSLKSVVVGLLNKVSVLSLLLSHKVSDISISFSLMQLIFLCPSGLQVFNWRVVDCELAIGLCTLLSKAEVFKLLWKVVDNTWQNYDKILVGNFWVGSSLYLF